MLVVGVVGLSFWNYNQPPIVVLTNRSGGPMSAVRIRIGDAEVNAGTLDVDATIRRTVPFRGSEASTEILWIDRAGVAHHEHANDYVEGRGGYRTTVVIDRDGRAIVAIPK